MKHESLMDGPGAYERWIRMPKRGHEPNCGLTRPHIYNLIRAGKIRSACLRQPGKVTGVRVVWLKSLMDYVERFAAGGEESS